MVDWETTTLWLAAVLLLGATSAWAVTVLVTTRARQTPPRLSAIKALFLLGRAGPRDLGFDAEAMVFESQAYGWPVELAAWYVPHPQANGRLVILLHGYADSGAGACAWLPMLHGMNVNVLILDLPGHGESGNAPCTAGWIERRCVWEVIDEFRRRRPNDAKEVVLYGLSMGAAVALAAAAIRPGISAVIADSPYADFREASVLHARLFGMPGTLLQRPANWLIGRRHGIVYSDIAPIDLLEKVGCPVLLIQAGNDRLIAPTDREKMATLVAQKHGGRAVTIEGAAHLLGITTSPSDYAHQLQSFLGSCVSM